MIEGRGIPTHLVVAVAARGYRKCVGGIGVRWIVGLLPGGQVAVRIPAAVVRNRGRQIVVIVDVAGLAGQRGVRTN